MLNRHNRISDPSLLFSPLRPNLGLLPQSLEDLEGRLGLLDGVAAETGGLLLDVFALVAGGKGGSGDVLDGIL